MASPTEPIVATFAPSVPPPVSTDPDCEDPVGGFNQCGGPGYEGSTCCRTGYDCEEMADCYFEVNKTHDGVVLVAAARVATSAPRAGGSAEDWTGKAPSAAGPVLGAPSATSGTTSAFPRM
ncbi:unnamed protein product, partial [Ectocarpus sp. 12 AP-2014]